MRSAQENWGRVILYMVSLLVVLSMICGTLATILPDGRPSAPSAPTQPPPTATRTPPPPAITAVPGTATPAPAAAPSPVAQPTQ